MDASVESSLLMATSPPAEEAAEQQKIMAGGIGRASRASSRSDGSASIMDSLARMGTELLAMEAVVAMYAIVSRSGRAFASGGKIRPPRFKYKQAHDGHICLLTHGAQAIPSSAAVSCW